MRVFRSAYLYFGQLTACVLANALILIPVREDNLNISGYWALKCDPFHTYQVLFTEFLAAIVLSMKYKDQFLPLTINGQP